jgi:hypothetical protein
VLAPCWCNETRPDIQGFQWLDLPDHPCHASPPAQSNPVPFASHPFAGHPVRLTAAKVRQWAIFAQEFYWIFFRLGRKLFL